MYKLTKIVYNLYDNSRPEKIKMQTFCKTDYELLEIINKQLLPETEFKVHKCFRKEFTNKQEINPKALNKLLKIRCNLTKEQINKDFKLWKQKQFVEKYDMFVEKKGE